ncbi:hypothetical protein Taro_040006 [Colocasia esculenta]|uniref:Ubiquitin-like protease family profile domain-containing protein n=1 Tax=Colocasia esculenta TaxID=4460 RepID=A0A843WC11_COLES|nr:hypothetical protein [Colocasia esculenta]
MKGLLGYPRQEVLSRHAIRNLCPLLDARSLGNRRASGTEACHKQDLLGEQASKPNRPRHPQRRPLFSWRYLIRTGQLFRVEDVRRCTLGSLRVLGRNGSVLGPLTGLQGHVAPRERATSSYKGWWIMMGLGICGWKLAKNKSTWILKKGVFSKTYTFVPIVDGMEYLFYIKISMFFLIGAIGTSLFFVTLGSHFTRIVGHELYKASGRMETGRAINSIPLLLPKVPQQNGGEECGVFMLYYMFLFAMNAPKSFSRTSYPYFLTMFSNRRKSRPSNNHNLGTNS